MRKSGRRAASFAAYLAILAMAACNGGHSTLPAASVGGGAAAAIPAGARGSNAAVYGQSLLSGATYVGPAQIDTIGLDVWIQMSNAQGLIQYAAEANNPKSPLYRHWLTPQEIGSRFGASQADYTRAVKYLNSYGIAVETFPQRQMLRVLGPRSGIEAALGFTFGTFKKGTQTFVAPMSAPNLPLAMKIVGLTSAVHYSFRHRNMVPVQAGNGLLQGYAPQQIANAFDYTGAYQAGYTGTGITIGIIGTGPITDDYPAGSGSQGDVAEFCHMYSVPCAPISQHYSTDANVSPGNPSVYGGQYSLGLVPPPAVTNPNSVGCQDQGVPEGAPVTNYYTCNPEDGEAQLDTEQAASLAPGARVQFYIAFNPNECYISGGPYTTNCPTPPPHPTPTPQAEGAPSQELGIDLTDDEIQEAIGEGTADIISMSFGSGEPDALGYYYNSSGAGFGPTEFATLAAEGVAIFASSGDNGAQGCADSTAQPNPNALCVGYPATDPNVVSVGGVNAPLDASGALAGPMTGWGQQTGNGGSGGGCSETFPALSWESSLATPDPCIALGPHKRSQPDISLDADLNTGVAVVLDAPPGLGGRVIEPVGGTSVAAPEAAAMWALVLSACKATAGCGTGPGAYPYRLGNPNYYYYYLYQHKYSQVFYDVLYGANGLAYTPYGPTPGPTATPEPTYAPGYSAGPGLDLVTGIGVPYAKNLIQAVLAGPSPTPSP